MQDITSNKKNKLRLPTLSPTTMIQDHSLMPPQPLVIDSQELMSQINKLHQSTKLSGTGQNSLRASTKTLTN